MNIVNKEDKNKNKKIIAIIVGIVVVLLIMIRLTSSVGAGPLEGAVKTVTKPAQSITYSGGSSFLNFFKGLGDYKNVKEENEKLKAQIALMESENEKLQKYRVENEDLKKALELKESNLELKQVSATVIGRSIKDWYKSVTINKGTKDGVRINMPVVTYRGLVGRVTSVTKSTAEVTLITDPEYGAIASITKESRYPGIVIGSGDGLGGLEMIQIPADGLIQEGYEVVTSGLGDMTFKDLKIGKIKYIENATDGLMKKAYIEPYENLNQLDYLMVITGENVV